MVQSSVAKRLREHGVQPSAQRVAVAEYVLSTDDHPSADEVARCVRRRFPMISRATIYNTLNLFVERRLLRQLTLAEGHVVFDPNMKRHHHFIDTKTGDIHDVSWDAVDVSRLSVPRGFELEEYQLVMRGHPKRPKARR